MEWKTTGTPHQIEVGGRLITKARLIATHMNEFFVEKIQTIRASMGQTPENLNVCSKIMNNKKVKLSLKHVSVENIKKL